MQEQLCSRGKRPNRPPEGMQVLLLEVHVTVLVTAVGWVR